MQTIGKPERRVVDLIDMMVGHLKWAGSPHSHEDLRAKLTSREVFRDTYVNQNHLKDDFGLTAMTAVAVAGADGNASSFMPSDSEQWSQNSGKAYWQSYQQDIEGAVAPPSIEDAASRR